MTAIQFGVPGIFAEERGTAFGAEEETACARPGSQKQEDAPAGPAAVGMREAAVGKGCRKQLLILAFALCCAVRATTGRQHDGASGRFDCTCGWGIGELPAAVTAARDFLIAHDSVLSQVACFSEHYSTMVQADASILRLPLRMD